MGAYLLTSFDRWDEEEGSVGLVFDRIDRLESLTRKERIEVVAYIMRKYAQVKGIPIPDHDTMIDTDLDKVYKENCGYQRSE